MNKYRIMILLIYRKDNVYEKDRCNLKWFIMDITNTGIIIWGG